MEEGAGKREGGRRGREMRGGKEIAQVCFSLPTSVVL